MNLVDPITFGCIFLIGFVFGNLFHGILIAPANNKTVWKEGPFGHGKTNHTYKEVKKIKRDLLRK